VGSTFSQDGFSIRRAPQGRRVLMSDAGNT